MAMPTNTFATYEAIGNREDLSDVIYRISPIDTPFLSGAETEKATAVNSRMADAGLGRRVRLERPARRQRFCRRRRGADRPPR